jgi:catechol 2,3-dioxygenase-like lactoylglutathione lyase family enzyme
MRGVGLFIMGLVVGLIVQTALAQNQNPSPNHGIVGLNHVGLSVTNLDEAVAYYTKTMGFPEAFRSLDANGKPALVYVQISKNTFVELQPATPQRPPGISHFGVVVDNMAQATAMFKQRGAKVAETRTSPTKVILSDITDVNGLRIELAELTPDSPHRQAMDRWK